MSLKEIRKDIQRRMLRRSLRLMSTFIMDRRYETECRRARNHLPALLPVVAEYIDKQRAAGGLYWDSTALKMIELHRLLVEVRPAFVVELGGGTTTCVTAHTLSEWGGRLLSIDEAPEYSNSTRDRLPEHLRQHVSFEVLTRVEEQTGGKSTAVHYDDRLREVARDFTGSSKIDLLYMDGPSNGKVLPCTDCSRLMDAGVDIPVLAFDCRHESARHFLETKHSLLYQRALLYKAARPEDDPWPVGDARHHTVFRRLRASS